MLCCFYVMLPHPRKKNRGRVKKSLCKKLPNPKCSMCRLARPYLRASFQWLSHIAETFMSSRRYRRHNIAQTARLFRRDYAAFVLASDKARRKKPRTASEAFTQYHICPHLKNTYYINPHATERIARCAFLPNPRPALCKAIPKSTR